MEITQNFTLTISCIEEPIAFHTFLEEEGEIFAEELDDDIDSSVEIETEEVYETFENMLAVLKAVVKRFPRITLELEGTEETTYDGFDYKVTYKDHVMTILTTESYFVRYPEDYDEFVDYCEEFSIDDVISEELWQAMNEEANGEWYFMDGLEAKTCIDFSNREIIRF